MAALNIHAPMISRVQMASGPAIKRSAVAPKGLGCSLSSTRNLRAQMSVKRAPAVSVRCSKKEEVKETQEEGDGEVDRWWLMAATVSTFMLPAEDAMATGRELGILEGKTIALVHPTIMFFLFGATAYAGYLGWQWRSVRTIGDQISELKKQLPAADASGAVPASPLGAQIAELTATRKELVSGGFRDRHHDWGNLLLSLGVMTSVAGGMNTYIRVGKLFPGPHLYAGVGITVLWAMAAALVPYMQKGNTAARNAHIALNCVNLGLFAWQVPTGIEIVGKVWQFAAWP
uniref:DUF4079 domain-containing protein n=1 Tax=Pyramimonas obovata TaxID=1411642 RepID=A0A7S0MZY1_9CHLO|mmetsp:Transcript_15763/g.34167  ORF Transcript_15763/g.34167 Transcript_15763/m.34167 type:complete len:288 (+) Transcript_15763:96-959(+)|eukprot:CAMPEP_0118934694 /NCGR_PEP_ID=MMETSP1169-20130426/13965_1 /TAXON_ID=36882 /ORGANISM="Pyramimonas obovata, Strain CCMP722" /LENGTH=287 /DNA_ID=CAMNT_0006877623 /DNA_START=75 /DNA_END=938 /DNA_ORIENTATION=+